jgi:hypothetical protein
MRMQAVDAVAQIGEATLLCAAVYQQDRRALDEVEDQLRDRARAADAARRRDCRGRGRSS